jgi:Flp pilus assembly protein TadG
MMRNLDQRGVAAFEFCLVAVPLFTLMFVIFDLGRYAITAQSLRTLANAGARTMMIKCSLLNPTVTQNSVCSGDPLPSDAAKQAVAPFLYSNGSPTPTLDVPVTATSPLTVTASQNFTMIMPVWPTTFNAPSASTSVPF